MSCSELEYEITALALCVGERFLSVGVWEPVTLTGSAWVELGASAVGFIQTLDLYLGISGISLVNSLENWIKLVPFFLGYLFVSSICLRESLPHSLSHLERRDEEYWCGTHTLTGTEMVETVFPNADLGAMLDDYPAEADKMG